ncbi:hypothetical protein HDU97_003524 [Phlyctochytrium planicorne]|nr:hypothetical protein HDU97_003524 [Phlyctochytrium planicorne]
MAGLTLEASQIVPFVGIVLAIFLYAFRRPNYIEGQQLYIFPWLMQILMGLAWLGYAVNQHDLFIYLQNIPALITAVAYTLQWHPYLRKKVRRAHSTAVVIGLTVLVLATLGTAVSPYLDPNVPRIGLGALTGLSTLVTAASFLREVIRSVFSDQVPTAMDFALAGLLFLFGGCWTAYGFYGANDPFIYVANMVWVGLAVLTLALLSYGAFRAGGLEMGWDSGSEQGDDDVTVDRLNRMSSMRSSFAESTTNRSIPKSFRNPYHEEHVEKFSEEEDVESGAPPAPNVKDV